MPYPTKRNDEVVAEILTRISGGETLAEICRSHEKFPHPSQFRVWAREDEALAIAYQKARDDGQEIIAEEVMDIIDSDPHTYDSDGGKRIDPASIAQKKMQAEYRLKLLAKWNPKKWGDKVDHTSSDGSMASKPSVVQFVAPDVKAGE